MCENERSCITINCGCGRNASTPDIGDSTPVGTVISYMGTKAPQHYLACDGAVLNIADYEALAQQIQDEFGATDYFGGNGIETFAVPDLRDEFLRGYHGEAGLQLSGDVGRHQEATTMPSIILWNDSTGAVSYPGGEIPSKTIYVNNADTMSRAVSNNRYVTMQKGSESIENLGAAFSSRPTNVAVLFCIKYE